MDGVGPMELRDGNVDIMGMPQVPLVDGIEGSTTLDETLGPDMVGGLLNKEKGSLKISLTWTSRGASGSVKGGLNFWWRNFIDHFHFNQTSLLKPKIRPFKFLVTYFTLLKRWLYLHDGFYSS
jgi:hypothetical protein